MTNPTILPGVWYTDCLPNGRFVDLYPNSHLETSFGRVELPRHQDILQVRLSNNGLNFAGTGHEDDIDYEWDGISWLEGKLAYGYNACIYDANDKLVVNRPGSQNITTSEGFRQVSSSGVLISSVSTIIYHTGTLWEYSEYDNLVIGQGGKGIYGEDPVIVLYQNRRILIREGICRFIRVRRWNINGIDTVSLGWVENGAAGRLIVPISELLLFPDAHDKDPVPPNPDPVPVPPDPNPIPPDPIPVPIPPKPVPEPVFKLIKELKLMDPETVSLVAFDHYARVVDGRLVFDKFNEDSETEFIISKPDSRFAIMKDGKFVGVDSTIYTQDITKQYYMTVSRGNYESFFIGTTPNGLLVAFVEYISQGANNTIPFISVPVTIKRKK